MWDYFEWEEVELCAGRNPGWTQDRPWTLHGPFLPAVVHTPQCENGERAPKFRRRQSLRIAWGRLRCGLEDCGA